MSPAVLQPIQSAAVADGGWTLRTVPEITSTNSAAARLPAWHALRAIVQTGGRGRTSDREWTSDAGGLWLSAVLPCPGARAQWEILPLAAGWAVRQAVRELGVTGVRLRWPNDLMVGRRKLAGLLVERYQPDTAVVGLGLNVFNRPERSNPSLAGRTTRLTDLIADPCPVEDVAGLVLRSLRLMHARLLAGEFGAIAAELNRDWAEPIRVAIILTGAAAPFEGDFHGIDERGRLRIATARHGLTAYDATQVALLREIG